MRNTDFINIITAAAAHSRLSKTALFIQHGSTPCLLHCIAVAYYCYRLAEHFKLLKSHEAELVRGALLHDYFLYDWHKKDDGHRWHGFRHGKTAARNAKRDYRLLPR